MSDHEKAQQLIADVLEEYRDELTLSACDRCEDCGPRGGGMCSFHSLLSALAGHAWTNGAIERDRLQRELSLLQGENERLTKALSAHLCEHDMADWLACSGDHNQNCYLCDGDEYSGDTSHARLVRAEAAERDLASLRDERDAARERAAALADALELKLMDFLNHGDGEMTLTLSDDDWRSMSAALKTAPEEDPRKCWPMTEDQYWRDSKLKQQLAALRAQVRQIEQGMREEADNGTTNDNHTPCRNYENQGAYYAYLCAHCRWPEGEHKLVEWADRLAVITEGSEKP